MSQMLCQRHRRLDSFIDGGPVSQMVDQRQRWCASGTNGGTVSQTVGQRHRRWTSVKDGVPASQTQGWAGERRLWRQRGQWSTLNICIALWCIVGTWHWPVFNGCRKVPKCDVLILISLLTASHFAPTIISVTCVEFEKSLSLDLAKQIAVTLVVVS